MLKRISVIITVLMFGAISIFAQNTPVRNLVLGQKYKIKGVVVSADSNQFVVRDATGNDTKVIVSAATSIKDKGFFGSDKYPTTAILRGLSLQVEGRGDNSGGLAATKIRFSESDLRVAQSIDSRVTPTEERLTQAEENAQRVSGQIDELMAISNAARGGAKAAQDSADAAIAGVNATNSRITSLDDYVVQSTSTVNFKVNSTILSPEAKQRLDEVAATALTMRGYVLEITGFASAEGGAQKNKVLSQKRAQAVIDYLVETHNIPLRRIGTSFGFGANQAIADNSTREGRMENRRVEVKLLVSRGINQNVEVKTVKDDGNDR